MRCVDFENRLNDAIDERRPLDEDAELRAHAAECGSCEGLLRDYESLLKCVVPLRATEPSAGFTLRVLSACETEIVAASRTAPVRGRMASFLALAASLLLLALPTWYWGRTYLWPTAPVGGEHQMQQASVPARGEQYSDSPAEQVAEANNVRPALVDQVSEAYEPYLVATTETFATALGSTSHDGDSDEEKDEAATRPIVWDGEFASEFRPVAASATRSVAALLRVLPGTTRPLDPQGLTQ